MSAAGSCAGGWPAASSWCVALEREERDPCRAAAPVEGQAAVLRPVRRQRPRSGSLSLELPLEERESVDAGIRHIEFLDAEVAAVERLIAQQALSWPEIRRLMSVPGVNLVCAASFMAAVGDTRRFITSRKLVAYLGLDPKVRQSGETPARSGRISKARLGVSAVGAGRGRLEHGPAARTVARVL